jgi:putative FmdB family regulatory protein
MKDVPMPLYEFACQHCNSITELLMNISSPHPNSCPNCQGGPLVKIISRSNFALKGSGWYTTDFKRKSSRITCPGATDTSDIPSSAGGKSSTSDD